jgi:hypothetical protein
MQHNAVLQGLETALQQQGSLQLQLTKIGKLCLYRGSLPAWVVLVASTFDWAAQ